MTLIVCCDSYRVYKVTYLLYYCNYIGVKYVTCVSVLSLTMTFQVETCHFNPCFYYIVVLTELIIIK